MRAYVPPCHAKEVDVDGSRRSPGFASKDAQPHTHLRQRSSQGSAPVTADIFLAYSCAAARDFHPLPCLHPAAKTRVPKEPLIPNHCTKSKPPSDESNGTPVRSQILEKLDGVRVLKIRAVDTMQVIPN